MSFMEIQITDKVCWIEVETVNGTWFVDAFYVSSTAQDFCQAVSEGLYEPEEVPATVACDILQYTECIDANDIQSVQYVEGFGARLSAPGYMDCTEWSVFETRQEAEDYLEEMYGGGD